MTTERPNVKPTGRYSTRETEMLLGLSKSTLLRHTQKGDIVAQRHKASGRKFYTGTEIIRYFNAVM